MLLKAKQWPQSPLSTNFAVCQQLQGTMNLRYSIIMLMNKSLGKDEFLSVPTMQMYLQKTKKNQWSA